MLYIARHGSGQGHTPQEMCLRCSSNDSAPVVVYRVFSDSRVSIGVPFVKPFEV